MEHSNFLVKFANVIELDRHIEILLLSNDCVIVPDFGGFMAHHVDARYDKNENLFLPPLRTIGFNPQLKMNDSLLAQSYVEAYDISYPEAVNRISDEVNELKQHLENYGSYELTDVGTLRLNEVGSYIFEPCEAGILTPNLYGLSSFEMKSLQTIAEEEKVTANSLQPTPTVTLTTTQSIFNDIEQEEDDKVVSLQFKMSVLRNLAAACIAIIVFLAVATPLGNNDSNAITRSKIDTGLLNRIMPKEECTMRTSVNANSVKKNNKKTIVYKNNTNETKSLTDNKDVEPSEYYTIVLASRVAKANAQEYVEQLKKKGLGSARVVTTPSTKVIYGTYKTENEAYKYLNQLHNQKEFSDGWITKVRN